MKKMIDFCKQVVLTLAGAGWLFCLVYVGAVCFMAAVVLEKALKFTGSRYTVEELVQELEYSFQTKYDHYRHEWDNFQFKHLRLPF